LIGGKAPQRKKHFSERLGHHLLRFHPQRAFVGRLYLMPLTLNHKREAKSQSAQSKATLEQDEVAL
jgi:hypothetical protein